ncbi:MAG: protein-disulfide reductase DsbD family protein [Chitinophagales bacterium]
MKVALLKSILLISFFWISLAAGAQVLDPVKWDFHVEQGEFGLDLIFHASIENSWYLYSQDVPEFGPIPTSFHFESPLEIKLDSFLLEKSSHAQQKYDEMFALDLLKYSKEVDFIYTLDPKFPAKEISGYLEFMCCDDKQCLAPKTIPFTFKIN